jgi:hypothetical protein
MKPQPRYHPGDKIGGCYQVHQARMGGMDEVYFCLDLEQNYPYPISCSLQSPFFPFTPPAQNRSVPQPGRGGCSQSGR